MARTSWSCGPRPGHPRHCAVRMWTRGAWSTFHLVRPMRSRPGSRAGAAQPWHASGPSREQLGSARVHIGPRASGPYGAKPRRARPAQRALVFRSELPSRHGGPCPNPAEPRTAASQCDAEPQATLPGGCKGGGIPAFGNRKAARHTTVKQDSGSEQRAAVQFASIFRALTWHKSAQLSPHVDSQTGWAGGSAFPAHHAR